MQTVLAEGGPFHTRGNVRKFVERLGEPERESWARLPEARHGAEL